MSSTSHRARVGPRPTLWRTCRALANTTRLKILRELLRLGDQSVSAIASKIRLSRPVATLHLRRLAARGLLRARRSGSWVHYTVEPDATIPEAESFVHALAEVLRSDARAVGEIYHLATAFTHPRRQAIYEELRSGDRTFAELKRRTAMSSRALRRHIAKLSARGFVVAAGGVYRAAQPPGRMAELLAALAPEAAR